MCRASLSIEPGAEVSAASRDLDTTSLGRETWFQTDDARPHWPTLSPASFRASGLRFLAATHVECRLAALRFAWLLQLAMSGMLVRRKRDASRQAAVLVVHSDQGRFVGMKVSLQSFNSKTSIFPAVDSVGLIAVDVATDPAEWMAVRCDPATTAGSDNYASGFSVACRSAVPLVNLAAAMGFRGMGITHLRRLASHLKVVLEDPRPVTEENWAKLLCSTTLKEHVNDGKIASIMKARDGNEDDLDLTSPLPLRSLHVDDGKIPSAASMHFQQGVQGVAFD